MDKAPSGSAVDAEAARELKRRLEEIVSGREAGLRVWLDVDGGLVSGAEVWRAQIEEAIEKTCTAFAVHVGSKGVVNWVQNEVRLALSRATRDKIPFCGTGTSPAACRSDRPRGMTEQCGARC